MEEKICEYTLSFTMVVTTSPTAKQVWALVRRTFVPWVSVTAGDCNDTLHVFVHTLHYE